MKVTVVIPEGKYCGGCPLLHHYRCYMFGGDFRPWEKEGNIKHPDCPSLKKLAKMK